MAGEEYVHGLAFMLHEELCGSAPDCPRLRPGSAHQDFYELRAQNIIRELEPLIGIANVLPVAKAVVREVAP